MALWGQVVESSSTHVGEVHHVTGYGEHFPVEVRHQFAAWIEGQDWQCSSGGDDNSGHLLKARSLYRALVSKISEAAKHSSDFPLKLKFQETLRKFEELYQSDPVKLTEVVRMNLQRERALVTPATQHLPGHVPAEGAAGEMAAVPPLLAGIRAETAANKGKLDSMGRLVENLNLHHATLKQLLDSPGEMTDSAATDSARRTLNDTARRTLTDIAKRQQLAKLQQVIHGGTLSLQHSYTDTLTRCQAIYDDTQRAQVALTNRLKLWKLKQRFEIRNTDTVKAGGVDYSVELTQLQDHCVNLEEIIYEVLNQIYQTQFFYSQLYNNATAKPDETLAQALFDRFTELLRGLVRETFIIEQQPPQVLKRDSRFAVLVRSLLSPRVNRRPDQPEVRAYILNESTYNRLAAADFASIADADTCGNIVNKTKMMDYVPTNGKYVATFNTMTVKSIKRADRRGNEMVTEEIFVMLFMTQFPGTPGPVPVHALSLPIVVTVHGNQECNARATIFWDKLFPGEQLDRDLFQPPRQVSWPVLARSLSQLFHVTTGRGLTEENLGFIASKLFRNSGNLHEKAVSWQQFSKDSMAGRSFSFWTWFYATMKMTREHMPCWSAHAQIHGFISKSDATQLLRSAPAGTFLLRFSESHAGGLAVSWVIDDVTTPGGKTVQHLAPFTEGNFKLKALPGLLHDLDQLTYLYPRIPKDEAFVRPRPETPEEVEDGFEFRSYIPHELKLVVKELAGLDVMSNGPGSVQSGMEEDEEMDNYQIIGGAELHEVNMDDQDNIPDDLRNLPTAALLGHVGSPHAQTSNM